MTSATFAEFSQLAIHKDGQKGSICGWAEPICGRDASVPHHGQTRSTQPGGHCNFMASAGHHRLIGSSFRGLEPRIPSISLRTANDECECAFRTVGINHGSIFRSGPLSLVVHTADTRLRACHYNYRTSNRLRHLRDCAAVRRQLGMTCRCWLELLTFWRTN